MKNYHHLKSMLKKCEIKDNNSLIYPRNCKFDTTPYKIENETLKKIECHIKDLIQSVKNNKYLVRLIKRKLIYIIGIWLLTIISLFIPTGNIGISIILLTTSSLILGGALSYIYKEKLLINNIKEYKLFLNNYKKIHSDDNLISKNNTKENNEVSISIEKCNQTLDKLKELKRIIEGGNTNKFNKKNKTKIYVKSAKK